MRLHSQWVLKSDKQSTPLVFEVLEVLTDGDLILRKGNFNKPVRYGLEAFEESFITAPPPKGD